ncbi:MULTISPECIES: glycosyltransferase family 4 protein [Nostocales]|uniref:Glycosyltransferase family 4 protein n=1 Tax=Dolichospermum flos-aquae UHCC 0037 TaxID=2590026 RepID=A0ACC7S8Y2_DOLFA|nr:MULTISPECIES: glycosyltransferase family 4 protein [Nostocales]QSV70039.1 MAG: glycosyltransferase family 4 protein [Aphanizomenon flos-aquae KM1D3_PB]KHG42136.1 glycosyl transferase family 1 [Aphanizomenon flos-aquae 2012/KM1/D3]MBE9257560.1 glycosyltransferase family 4 protein [Dolichospermum sp. LEGE 00246]MBO1065519.1 glycosyltransferase family 4 protein [Anabaena sp. 54]MTJ32518.1 glycosyltransferase family 4 protein [Aphanizomenon sp. UHCC 0183]
MKVLFLDQSGKPGGAELCLVDIAKPYGENALVGLFADGNFRKLLEENQVPVEVLTTQAIKVGKQSGLFQALGSLGQIVPLITQVVQRARKYDLIYANTQKALVVGAVASFLARRPLVYHLHDILSLEHFSKTNLRVAVNLINRCAALVIANSQASKMAFLEAGGKSDLVRVVYNGFAAKNYEVDELEVRNLREHLRLEGKFVIGHFSRLSPWKGQHILIDALSQCPQDVVVILVGDALFGEQEYVKDLHQKVAGLGLENRVNFLGFRADIPQLMTMCDLITHTSIAAEPFGRVIVEAMLCGKPVIAAEAGGAMELVEDGINGFLVTPGEPQKLAQVIHNCRQESVKTANIANNARISASERFDVRIINQQIQELLKSIISPTS